MALTSSEQTEIYWLGWFGLIERNCLSVCFPLGVSRARCVGWSRGWGDDQGPDALRSSPWPGSPLMVWSMSVRRRADSLGRGNHLKEESFREDLWDAFISLKCVQQTGFDWQRLSSSAASALAPSLVPFLLQSAEPVTLTGPGGDLQVRRWCWFRLEEALHIF